MEINLAPPLKPLIANFNRIGIGKYLKTSEYDNLLLEKNLDNMWNLANKEVNKHKTVVFLGFDDYGSDEEEAIQLVLNLLFEKNELPFLESFLFTTLNGYLDWGGKKEDLSKVINCLPNLKISDETIQTLKAKNQSVLEKGSAIKSKIESTDNSEPHPILLSNQQIKADKKQCFVIMPFNDKLNPIYESIIKPVLKELKLKSIRADEIFTSKPIISDIWDSIRKSGILIADLTGQNPNVFYELGLAHALNKDVILMSQSLEDVPFDLKHNRIVIYKDSISGAEQLKSQLRKFIQYQLENEKAGNKR